jgi:hypothetical protein
MGLEEVKGRNAVRIGGKMGVWGRCGGYGGVAIIGDLEWLRWLWGGSETV